MKNYIDLLTKEDILNILQKNNYLIEDQFKNENGDYVLSIQKQKNSILIRCKRIPNEEELAIHNAILNSPQGQKIMYALSIFDCAFFNRHNVVIIEDFNIYTFDTGYRDSSNNEELFNSFLSYMINKFGKKYVNDYKKYWKKIEKEQKEENTDKEETEDLSL